MANTILTPSVIARRALATLYNTAVLATLVHRDYDEDFAGKQGDTITVRSPAVFTANEFDRATGITVQDITEGSFTVSLDKLIDVSFAVTSEELTLEIDDFDARLLQPAMEAIAQKVDGDLASELIAAAGAVGGGGMAARGSGLPASDAVIEARTTLSNNKFPTTERAVVLSPDATSEALHDELFVQADRSGSTDALREASVGRVFGFDSYESQVFENEGGVAFHRTAVALVTRTLERPAGKTEEQAAAENYKGLGIRVVKDYDINKKQDIISVDFLYGISRQRPAGAVGLDLAPVA